MRLKTDGTLWQRLRGMLVYGGVLMFLMVFISFSVFYLASSYDALVRWFYSLNSCFYRSDEWTQLFFTREVKNSGNYFALAAMVLGIAGLTYIIWNRKRYFGERGEQVRVAGEGSSRDWLWYVPVIVAGFVHWYWGQANVHASADEIFSAVNCAELPAFQTMAYYMLPNNHIYFNVVNGLLCKLLHADAVTTGRVISLLAYEVVLRLAYSWCRSVAKSRVWAYLLLAPIALQFTVWTFGFQARGYECQLMCGWYMFLSMFQYLRTGSVRALRINAFFCVVGFALVPTFLFYFLAQLAYVFCIQLLSSKFVLNFWKYQFYALCGVFLLYLPALCFSGWTALSGNDYVKSPHVGAGVFLPHLLEVFSYFVNYVFGFLIRENHPVMFVLFCLPLVLFFFKGKTSRQLVGFYVVLWLVWAAVCVYMEKCPFSRNMIIHYSLSMAIIMYTLYMIIDKLVGYFKSLTIKRLLKPALLVVPVVFFCVHLVVWGSKNAPYLLYFMNVNDMYKDYTTDVALIPEGSSVACSPERYCYLYYCSMGNYKVSKCFDGREDYYVTSWGEVQPKVVTENYELFKKGNEGDMIYKRRGR